MYLNSFIKKIKLTYEQYDRDIRRDSGNFSSLSHTGDPLPSCRRHLTRSCTAFSAVYPMKINPCFRIQEIYLRQEDTKNKSSLLFILLLKLKIALYEILEFSIV